MEKTEREKVRDRIEGTSKLRTRGDEGEGATVTAQMALFLRALPEHDPQIHLTFP